ncbi:hypothetical protein GH714_017072 [Hevea brasiliensis]|uniref:DUF659 domain-containing protein n=1 Tax=Hevea brasiliensis TaxID=3981 RepID=A0A6A6KUA2_HEVBR|nr:hypothetical protein GH714_017072 [Hevea brasiliensis]
MVATRCGESEKQIGSYLWIKLNANNSNWNLQKCTLNFFDVPPPHTGVVICDVLQKYLVEWGIVDKVWTISIDNVTYNDAAIRMLKDNLAYKNSLTLNGKVVSCEVLCTYLKFVSARWVV